MRNNKSLDRHDNDTRFITDASMYDIGLIKYVHSSRYLNRIKHFAQLTSAAGS